MEVKQWVEIKAWTWMGWKEEGAKGSKVGSIRTDITEISAVSNMHHYDGHLHRLYFMLSPQFILYVGFKEIK